MQYGFILKKHAPALKQKDVITFCMACKIMSGQDVRDFTFSKPNMSTLQQRVRKKNKEKPSGRKPPRKNDFSAQRNCHSDDEGLIICVCSISKL